MTTETAARQNVTSRMAICLALALILALGASRPASSQSPEAEPDQPVTHEQVPEPVTPWLQVPLPLQGVSLPPGHGVLQPRPQ